MNAGQSALLRELSLRPLAPGAPLRRAVSWWDALPSGMKIRGALVPAQALRVSRDGWGAQTGSGQRSQVISPGLWQMKRRVHPE